MRIMRTSWLPLLILLGFSKSTTQSTNTTCDFSKEFDCGNGICLPKAWQCDNVKDCHNGADEIDCKPKECEEGDFLCRRCMHRSSKCNGIPDCSDGSDEEYCEYNSRRLGVPFHFGDPSLYIDNSGFDEDGCVPGFGYCTAQQTCIPNRSFCDGKPDCFLGFEDELHCTQDEQTGLPMWAKHLEYPCKDKFVCKRNETYKDNKCIQMSELCNGKKECPLEDDESEKCSECSTKHCEHRCQNTPYGAKCECNKGYRLDSDGFTCVDIDECASPVRACEHFCENRNGSFRCSCTKGYHLMADGKSCELKNSTKGSLLLNFRNEIEERPLEDFSRTNFTSVFHKMNGSIQAFDYFHTDRKLFMMTCEVDLYCPDGKLVVKEDGRPSRVLRENVSYSLNLAVDWIGGNIFFTEIARGVRNDTFPVAKISVCTMDGKFCRGIVEAREPSAFSNFVIHPMRGLLFYTQIKNNATRIMMESMDGSQTQVLFETNSTKLTPSMSIAIDYLNHDLYFGGMGHAKLQRINIDTKKTKIIASKYSMSVLDSMVYHSGFLYSTEFTGHIQALEVSRENARPHLVSHADKFMGLPARMAINDSRHQLEPSHNPCHEMDCPWICVIVPGFIAKCLCPDGYILSMLGTTCIPNSLETETPSNLSYIGLEAMRAYCKTGVGCLNGGSCREVSNKTRIVCDCLESYDGLYCERRKPMLSDEAVLIIILVIILLLLSIAIGCGVYWYFFYRRNKKDGVSDTIPLVSKSLNGRFEDNPLSF